MVARASERYRQLYNAVRPHEALGFRTPLTCLAGLRRPVDRKALYALICLIFLTRDIGRVAQGGQGQREQGVGAVLVSPAGAKRTRPGSTVMA